MEKLVTNLLLHIRIIIMITPVIVVGQTYENVTRLRAELLNGYHVDVRPMNNHSETMNVNISATLISVQEVDQIKGVLTVVMITFATWYDQRMTWNPSEFGGITEMIILIDEVWTPLITLAHPVEFTVMGNSNSHVTYHSNGLAVFSPGAVLQCPCNFNTQFWPFDKQICDIGFYPMDYTKDKVQFHIVSPGINKGLFTPNSEWTLDNTSYYVRDSNSFSAVYFRLKLSRQSLFYVVTTILPIIGIGCLSCLVFLLPSDSGERVSFIITILLALAVFLTVIEDDLPKSSDPVSLICIFILSGIILNIFTCVFIIGSLSIFYRDEKIPKCKWHIAIVKISNCKRKKRTSNKPESKEYSTNKTEIYDVNEPEYNDGRDTTWPDVSRALDRIAFIVSIILLIFPPPIFLAYLRTASDYPEP